MNVIVSKFIDTVGIWVLVLQETRLDHKTDDCETENGGQDRAGTDALRVIGKPGTVGSASSTTTRSIWSFSISSAVVGRYTFSDVLATQVADSSILAE